MRSMLRALASTLIGVVVLILVAGSSSANSALLLWRLECWTHLKIPLSRLAVTDLLNLFGACGTISSLRVRPPGDFSNYSLKINQLASFENCR